MCGGTPVKKSNPEQRPKGSAHTPIPFKIIMTGTKTKLCGTSDPHINLKEIKESEDSAEETGGGWGEMWRLREQTLFRDRSHSKTQDPVPGALEGPNTDDHSQDLQEGNHGAAGKKQTNFHKFSLSFNTSITCMKLTEKAFLKVK